ncbi:hypothetical protein HYG89_04765 [Acinetobacter sp. SwsAc5]|uniref:hypothetical protein n=1 Tax=Acinetobacter sp. SwsAc5 TaxID=2749438 RepID=UPI0015BD24FB|nr:hypothetical protein [Acinetobacter sp. SwsAc5]NWK51877.1 hypothetical protein [Acinetobacter sp. SwsAc5]
MVIITLSANGVKSMSAFLVSAKHIAIVCNAVVFDQTNQRIFFKWLDDIKKSVHFPDSVVEFEKQFIQEIQDFEDELSQLDNFKLLAKILANANFVSLQYRYPKHDHGDIELYLSRVHKFSMRDDLGGKDLNVIQFLKFVHCLNYQSCEHPDYKKSFAYKFIKLVEELAIYNSPEYSKAEWCA